MQRKRMLYLLVIVALFAAALPLAVQAAEGPVDLTKTQSPPVGAQAGGGAVPWGGTVAVLDDFNRADGPIGPNWTVRDGSCNVVSNAATCSNMGRATFNSAPGTGDAAEMDVAVFSTSLDYQGLLLNYGAGATNIFIKVQNQAGGMQFGHAACYTGNNGAAFGLGFFALSSPFGSAHMAVTRVGDDVTISFTNIDGGAQSPQTYVCSGAPPREGTGIGINGYAGLDRVDNFGGPGGPTQTPNIDVSPLSMSATQASNTTTSQTLNVGNTGTANLTWNIDEDPAPRPVTVPTGGSVTKLSAPPAAQRSAKELYDLLHAPNANVVADGGFEAGTPNPFWTEYSLNFGTVLCDAASCGTGAGTSYPRTGDWWAWFGGIAAYEAGSVSQSVTIPSGGPATLTFWVMNGACSGDAADYLEVNMDNTQLWQTTGASPECGVTTYRQITLDVSAYANGGAHTLEFNSEVFGSDNTNFALDDVSLDAESGPTACVSPVDVPWLSVSPVSGTTAPAATTPVTVGFNSTGLVAGTYHANLCVYSNDPDAGPGNGTDLVIVPVELIVQGPTAVTLDAVAAAPLPIDVPWTALPATLGLAAAAAYTLRRKK